MRTKNFMWQMMSRYIIAMVVVFVCSACEPPVPPIDPVNPDFGEVEFVIDFSHNNESGEDNENNNKGDGTAESPLEVTEEEPLDVVVTQESSYTDPDGSVYTCEPKASVGVYALESRVYAKDIEALTKISENIEVNTTTSGDNPVLYSTEQVFAIGGQKVVFNLSHEVFTYVNSQDKQIEMPYIKVNEANFGYGAANDSEMTRAKKSPISLRALNLTRASITDEVEFEVSARFSVELEGVNTKSEQSKSIEIEIKYIGIVENVTELDGLLTYDIDSSSENYEVSDSGELVLTINQVGTFSNDGESIYSAEPKAYVKLNVAETVCSVGSEELLEKIVQSGNVETSKNGENPIVNVCRKAFDANGKKINFETSYEVYKIDENDNIPYLEIGEPYLVGVEIVGQDETRADIVETRYYDVKAKFEVKLIGKNVNVPIEDTVEFVVNYQGVVENQVLGELSYVLESNLGDNNSPFEISGVDELVVTINENSFYTFNGELISSCEPKGYIKLKANNEMVTAENEGKLTELINTDDAIKSFDGQEPVTYRCQKIFATEGQTFEFDLSYDVYPNEKYGYMPYLEIGEPLCVGIDAKMTSYNEEEKSTYYDVTATFKVVLMGHNVENPIEKTLVFNINYQAKIVLELLKTEYKKEAFIEAPKAGVYDFWVVYYKVIRTRTYSDNTTSVDEFYSRRFAMEAPYLVCLDRSSGEYGDLSGTSVTKGDFEVTFVQREEIRTDFSIDSDGEILTGATADITSSMVVSSFDNVKWYDLMEYDAGNLHFPSVDSNGEADWSEAPWCLNDKTTYVNLDARDANGEFARFDPQNPLEGTWYYKSLSIGRRVYIKYGVGYIFRSYEFVLCFYDMFLYIDGQIFGFEDCLPKINSSSFTMTEFEGTNEHGPGRIYEQNDDVTYLGFPVSLHTIDTIYTPSTVSN